MGNDTEDVPQASGEHAGPVTESGGADWLLWAIPLGMVIAMVIGTAVLFVR